MKGRSDTDNEELVKALKTIYLDVTLDEGHKDGYGIALTDKYILEKIDARIKLDTYILKITTEEERISYASLMLKARNQYYRNKPRFQPSSLFERHVESAIMPLKKKEEKKSEHEDELLPAPELLNDAEKYILNDYYTKDGRSKGKSLDKDTIKLELSLSIKIDPPVAGDPGAIRNYDQLESNLDFYANLILAAYQSGTKPEDFTKIISAIDEISHKIREIHAEIQRAKTGKPLDTPLSTENIRLFNGQLTAILEEHEDTLRTHNNKPVLAQIQHDIEALRTTIDPTPVPDAPLLKTNHILDPHHQQSIALSSARHCHIISAKTNDPAEAQRLIDHIRNISPSSTTTATSPAIGPETNIVAMIRDSSQQVYDLKDKQMEGIAGFFHYAHNDAGKDPPTPICIGGPIELATLIQILDCCLASGRPFQFGNAISPMIIKLEDGRAVPIAKNSDGIAELAGLPETIPLRNLREQITAKANLGDDTQKDKYKEYLEKTIADLATRPPYQDNITTLKGSIREINDYCPAEPERRLSISTIADPSRLSRRESISIIGDPSRSSRRPSVSISLFDDGNERHEHKHEHEHKPKKNRDDDDRDNDSFASFRVK